MLYLNAGKTRYEKCNARKTEEHQQENIQGVGDNLCTFGDGKICEF